MNDYTNEIEEIRRRIEEWHYSNFHRKRKSTYSASFFEAEKMFFPNAGIIEKQAVPDIARHVQMNGYAVSVKSQESNAPNVPTKHLLKCPMM